MTSNSGNEELTLPETISKKTVSRESPFSLQWLNALNPRIFTPVTWVHGRETTIRLRAPDATIKINVSRIVSHYIDGVIELKDETYSFEDTEAGNHDVTQFKYLFGSDEDLTDFDRSTSLGIYMQSIVSKLGGLVYLAGSTIQASNYRSGPESNFVSDGSQWVEARTGLVVPSLPEIVAKPSVLEPSTSD